MSPDWLTKLNCHFLRCVIVRCSARVNYINFLLPYDLELCHCKGAISIIFNAMQKLCFSATEIGVIYTFKCIHLADAFN